MRKSGNRVFASSFLTDGWTMTSSPGTQLMGVYTPVSNMSSSKPSHYLR
jgi:hypothetical protein